jgi:hypothetical protein
LELLGAVAKLSEAKRNEKFLFGGGVNEIQWGLSDQTCLPVK